MPQTSLEKLIFIFDQKVNNFSYGPQNFNPTFIWSPLWVLPLAMCVSRRHPNILYLGDPI